MATVMQVLHFLSIFGSAIAAGTLVMIAFALLPIVRELPAGADLQVLQRVDPRVDRFNPPCVIVAAVAGLLTLIVHDGLSTAAAVFLILGIVGMLVVAAISLGAIRPISAQLHGWSAAAPPAQYADAQERWARLHTIRTVAGVLGLACFIIAGLV